MTIPAAVLTAFTGLKHEAPAVLALDPVRKESGKVMGNPPYSWRLNADGRYPAEAVVAPQVCTPFTGHDASAADTWPVSFESLACTAAASKESPRPFWTGARACMLPELLCLVAGATSFDVVLVLAVRLECAAASCGMWLGAEGLIWGNCQHPP